MKAITEGRRSVHAISVISLRTRNPSPGPNYRQQGSYHETKLAHLLLLQEHVVVRHGERVHHVEAGLSSVTLLLSS